MKIRTFIEIGLPISHTNCFNISLKTLQVLGKENKPYQVDFKKLNVTQETQNSVNTKSSYIQNWPEAARISIILAVSHVFIAFLTLYNLEKIIADPGSFVFDLFKFAGASFFGTFIALTGLTKYRDR